MPNNLEKSNSVLYELRQLNAGNCKTNYTEKDVIYKLSSNGTRPEKAKPISATPYVKKDTTWDLQKKYQL
jgi:hypothetical protein